MPPRKRTTKPAHGALRTALEADLDELELETRRALVELARTLADHLDREPVTCPECGGHAGPDAARALRYADALEALGIGRVPQQEPEDEFTAMRRSFDEARRARQGG
jgi:hypothetical protein